MCDELVTRMREPCQCENCVLCQEAAESKTTNADRIRAMTDEELAEWLEAHCYQYGWLDWLKQEAEPGAKL